MLRDKGVLTILVISLGLIVCAGSALAEEKKSADAVAKELSNPAGSLASLNFNLEYFDYKGHLRKSDNQNSTALTFQPILPFPVGDKGRKIIFRPLFSVPFDQPVFEPAKGNFDDADAGLADTTFDLVYAGNEMETKHKGYLWGIGLAGTLPTATSSDLKGEQWRFGPELFGGIHRKWGIVGALVSHQWDTGGPNDKSFNVTAAQYFYAISLGQGWQIASSPVLSYDWQADNDEAWTIPIGIGMAKTTKLGNHPWKFQFQVQKYVAQPDTFGPDWLVKLTITPVIKNPFIF
jgi:hypothetical protein